MNTCHIDYLIYIMCAHLYRQIHTLPGIWYQTHQHSTHMSFPCSVHMCLLTGKYCLSPCLSFLASKLRTVTYLWLILPSLSTSLFLFHNCLSPVVPSLQKWCYFFPILKRSPSLISSLFAVLHSSSFFIFLFSTTDQHPLSVSNSLPSFSPSSTVSSFWLKTF